MEGKARPASLADLSRLQTLLTAAYAASLAYRGGQLLGHPFRAQEDVQGRLAIALSDDKRADDTRADDTRAAFVGLVDDYVVGLSLAHVDRSFRHGPIGVIDELFVEPQARGVGVGEALLSSVVDWCTEQGCVGADMSALPGDRDTKNLCERSGFTARLLVMHRRLTPTSTSET